MYDVLVDMAYFTRDQHEYIHTFFEKTFSPMQCLRNAAFYKYTANMVCNEKFLSYVSSASGLKLHYFVRNVFLGIILLLPLSHMWKQ